MISEISKEFHIGNYVINQKGDFSGELIGQPKRLCYNGNGLDDLLWIDFFLPIKLNKKWLEDFNFSRDFDSFGEWVDAYFDSNIRVSLMQNKWWVTLGGLGGFQLPYPVEYVHELQNIYYFNFKEELYV